MKGEKSIIRPLNLMSIGLIIINPRLESIDIIKNWFDGILIFIQAIYLLCYIETYSENSDNFLVVYRLNFQKSKL